MLFANLAPVAFAGFRNVPTIVGVEKSSLVGDSSTLALPKPAGTVSGDMMLAIMATDNANALQWTPASGWTELVDQNAAPDLCVAYKAAGGSEGSSYSFGFASSQGLVGQIVTLRRAGTPTIGTIGTASGDGTVTAASMTAVAGLLIGAFAGNGASDTVSPPGSPSLTTPGGMAPLLDATNEGNGAQFARVLLRTFHEAVIAGATGARASTFADGTTSAGKAAAALINVPYA